MIARVMVVDDDPLVRRTLSSALARAGFDVCTADDGEPALRLAEVAPPDLVIVDFNMPTPGLDLVRALKARHAANIFVAVLTGEESENIRAECEAAGADAVMSKPISPSELRRRLTAAAVSIGVLPAA